MWAVWGVSTKNATANDEIFFDCIFMVFGDKYGCYQTGRRTDVVCMLGDVQVVALRLLSVKGSDTNPQRIDDRLTN